MLIENNQYHAVAGKSENFLELHKFTHLHIITVHITLLHNVHRNIPDAIFQKIGIDCKI